MLQLVANYKGILTDIVIIAIFSAVCVFIFRDLVFIDFTTWDVVIPNHDPVDNLMRAFQPISNIGIGGSWLSPTYPIIIESIFSSIFGNISAGKLMSFIPLPLSFTTLFFSTRRFGIARPYCIIGGILYAISPISLALVFSWGQQWFYALLPILFSLTYFYTKKIYLEAKFPLTGIFTLSIAYAFALSFMIQGLFVVLPIVSLTMLWIIVFEKEKHAFTLRNFRRLVGAIALSVSLVYILLLPYSSIFLLPSFSFFSSGEFANDTFNPSANTLYSEAFPINTIRLAGIGGYHLEQLGFNKIDSPSNLVGLSYYTFLVIFPVVFLVWLRRSIPNFNLLIIVFSILVCGLILLELGRSGWLWMLPLSAILRNPIKLLMLISLASAILAPFSLWYVASLINKQKRLVTSTVCIILLFSIGLYNFQFLNGTVWIRPQSEYWASLGHPVDWKGVAITPQMINLVNFSDENTNENERYRVFTFPLMPTQKLFFRNNLPVLSADVTGATTSEQKYLQYMQEVNRLMLEGKSESAFLIAPLSGKYIASIHDLESVSYSGTPRLWGGSPGALTGDSKKFDALMLTTGTFKKISESPSIFVNEQAIPTVSYTNDAILVDGDLNTVKELYNYITVKQGNIPVVLFKDSLSPTQIDNLLQSGVIKAYIHAPNSKEISSVTDAYFPSISSFLNDNSVLPHLPGTYILDNEGDNNSVLSFEDNSTKMITQLPVLENRFATFSYVLDEEIDISLVNNLSISLMTSATDLTYRVAFFNNEDQQILFDIKSKDPNKFVTYQLELKDGMIFDKGGVKQLSSMDLKTIRKIQVGFKDPLNLSDTTVTIKLGELSMSGPLVDELGLTINLTPAYFAKDNNSILIKTDPMSVPPDIIINKQIVHGEQIASGLYQFTFPKIDNVNSEISLRIYGHYVTIPVKSMLIVTGADKVMNPESLLTSDIHKVDYLMISNTDLVLQTIGSDRKLLLFSYLYDENWVLKDSLHIPVYGFLNGFLLSENQTESKLRYQLQDTIDLFNTFLVITWLSITAIFVRQKLWFDNFTERIVRGISRRS